MKIQREVLAANARGEAASPQGEAILAELVAATSQQPPTTEGPFAGGLKKKLGLTSPWRSSGAEVYRLAD